MAVTHRIVDTYSAGGRSSGGNTREYSGSQETYFEESIANGGTDVVVAFTLDVSACKSFFIISDKDITLETNSGSAADDTIALLANRPYQWDTESYDSFLLGTDVTALYFTNSSGAAATVKCHALTDATP